uniref:Ubiquitin specific peptidase like 1 n=1 Tax=Takifugu rubripes TaxID=31033 RepID=H2V599_TAKRU
MDPTRRSGLSLSGEDTDLEALSSPLVGYLGKKRAALLENCPWCTSKGLTFALRSYHVNLHESIPVCTNPQCLFPLVSRSLEDILASLVPVDQPVGSKRKNTFSLGREDPIEPDHKRKRFSDIIAGAFPSPAEQVAPAVGSEEQTCLSRADVENGYDREPLALVVDKGPEKVPCSTEAFNLLTSPDLSRSPHETLHSHSAVVSSPSLKDETVSSQHEAARGHTSLSAHEHFDNIQPEDEDVEEMKSSDLLPLPGQLFWPNSENLCWLDSMLVALVNCKSLKRCRPAVEPQESCVWRLMREYEDICSAVPDEVVMVSNNLLRKTNTELQRLRMWIFQQLQPKLHCKLGKEETPVFALPLLLAMDTWAEPLFQSVLRWEFRCDGCSVATQERVRKTLPTFTDVVPDWLPLHAVHLAPCNTCWRKHQRRTMTLESLPPVFGLHFVQGLPDNDVRKYSFSFNGNLYGVSTVIQYNQQLRHFVTWVCSSNGVWLEYDDLKHPECKTHGKLPIPAEEMHIVFWEVEVEEGEGPAACAPSSSFPDNPPPEGQMGSRPADGGNGSHVTDPTAADASIGSTTLLDTFEGLSHDDIITFTLLDITPGFDIQPVNDSGPVQSCGAPTTSGTPDSAPDSSSAEPPTASAAAMYHSFGIKSSVPQNAAPVLRSAPSHHNTTSPPSLDTRDHVEVLSSGRCGSRSSKSPPCLNHTEALRYKLIKKLKAKKKKLAKLNGMLGYQGPDSTDLTSPSSVSSTYGGSLLLDLLSPATTASHLSPDSTSVLDMIATGQGGVTRRDSGGGGGDPAGQRGRGGSALSALDLFV